MSKRKIIRKLGLAMDIKVCDPGVCSCCQYLGEGDFLCDKHMEIVIADWIPTENFLMCEEKG